MKIKSKFCSLGKNTDLSNNSDTECKTHNIADSNKIDSLLHSNKTDIWKQNNEKKEEEISREEEFNEYLNQLFL